MAIDVGERRGGGVNSINITPLVDVCLVLVLIFMITMPYSILRGIDVRRETLKKYGLTTPTENVTAHLTLESLRIEDSEGVERPIADADAETVLVGVLSSSKGKGFFLRVDYEVTHGRTVWIMDLAKRGGATSISLME
jgi:biopolymer transport protein ExbD